jgi:hypothetical protein
LQYLPGAYYAHRLHGQSLTMLSYGRYQALRVAARARREVLGIGVREYQRQLAAAYVEEAFAAYGRRDRAHLRRCLAAGLLRNPGWLRNRGVASLAWQSVVGLKGQAPHPSGGRPA